MTEIIEEVEKNLTENRMDQHS